MKRLFKVFTLVFVLLCATLLTGCSKEDQFTTISNPATEADIITLANVQKELDKLNAEKAKDAEQDVIIGFYNIDTNVLYIGLNPEMPEGKYYVVTGLKSTLPSMEKKGANFSGWYTTAEFVSGTKVTATGENTKLYAKYMTFAEAGIVAVVCMAIVFGMLALIAGIISLFKFIAPKEEAKPVVKPNAPQVQAARPALKLEDIKDEDMMAAALVATIDYHEETKEDVRVVSIKQIG